MFCIDHLNGIEIEIPGGNIGKTTQKQTIVRSEGVKLQGEGENVLASMINRQKDLRTVRANDAC